MKRKSFYSKNLKQVGLYNSKEGGGEGGTLYSDKE